MSYLFFALLWIAGMGILCAIEVRSRPKRHGRKTVVPAPEPRTPRDLSRPYPSGDEAANAELLETCPVCGMTDPGNLNGDLLGWPAHSECREWLGDWKPAKPAVVTGGEYAAEPVWCQGGTTNTIVFTGTGTLTAAGGGGGAGGSSINNMAFVSPEAMAIQQQIASGCITVDEARERLDREITSTFGVPPLYPRADF